MTTTIPVAASKATRDPSLAIDLHQVAKTYRGKIKALRGIEMRVTKGEVFGLLGPNGAGKSTLVKILMTVIKPSKCSGTMLNKPVGHKPTLARIGYLPEHHNFPPYLTGSQVVDHIGAMTGLARRSRKQRTGELLDLVGMTRWASTRVKRYSKGMRQRIGIAQALINDPDLILLDEPTDGVDPVGRRDIRNIVSHLKDQNKTIFINSHLLSELEMVCDRVAILVQGKVAQQGTIDDLTADRHRYIIQIQSAQGESEKSLAAAMNQVSQSPGMLHSGEAYDIEGDTVFIKSTEPQVIQPVIDQLRQARLTISSVKSHRPSLEDLFMQAVIDPTTGQELAPGAVDNARKGARS